ncbi:MAG: tetratricopeptide repeat protein [Bacteroidota bacterium]
MKYYFTLLFISSFILLKAQSSIEDSLLVVLKNEKTDTAKVDILNELAYEVSGNKAFEAQQYAERSLEIAHKINYYKGIAKAYSALGVIAYQRGDYSNALKNNFAALAQNEKIKNKRGIATCYNNIGLVYVSKGEFDKAISYHSKSLAIKQQLNDEKGISASYNNIGNVYSQLRQIDSSEFYHKKALAIREKNNDVKGMATSYYNLANNNFDLKKYKSALDYHFKALAIFIELKEVFNISYTYAEIANNYLELGDYKLAKKYADLALQISSKYQIKEAEMESYKVFNLLYEKTNNPAFALTYYKKYIQIRDSVKSESSAAEIAKLETEFQYEKKIEAQKAEQIRKDELQQIESKKQRLFIVLVSVVLILVILFSYYLFSRLKLIRKQKDVIEKQKHLVDEKQKEIVDSITYAKRLQQAILPPDNLIQKHLPNSFILYKPKDIVAGDFYWLEVKNDLIMIAAADCTGHGVPGAMVSVVCSNALNRTVKEFGLTEPGKILDKVRELVIETFEKSESEVKDGMDISLCVIDFKTKKLQWSGANNPLWIIRREIGDNKQETDQPGSNVSNLNSNILLEYKADKQPIGKYAEQKPFTTNEINLKKEDTIYIFTDGYADQFGGEKGKKYTYKRLREKLLCNADKSAEVQNEILDKDFETWKGEGEQVDDVCLIGIRI